MCSKESLLKPINKKWVKDQYKRYLALHFNNVAYKDSISKYVSLDAQRRLPAERQGRSKRV